MVSSHTADSKPVKQEVKGTVILLQVQGDHQRKDWRGGRGARRTGADVIKLFTFHECS